MGKFDVMNDALNELRSQKLSKKDIIVELVKQFKEFNEAQIKNWIYRKLPKEKSKFDDVKIEKKYNSKKECLDDLVKNYPNLTRAQLSSWINRKGYRFGGKCQVLNDNEKVKEIIHNCENLRAKKKEMLDKILQLDLGLEKGVVLSWLNRKVSPHKQ
jgi:hypothetical protein